MLANTNFVVCTELRLLALLGGRALWLARAS